MAPRFLPVSLFAAVAFGASSVGAQTTAPTPASCSDSWHRSIEKKVGSGDGKGHGPDIGSEEWKSVIEFRLGVRGNPGVPPRTGDAWCGYIDKLIAQRSPASVGVGTPPPSSGPRGPSFNCREVAPGSIGALVCGDSALSALDRNLAGVYAAALKKNPPPELKAEQRGWVKGRDECWKEGAKRTCVQEAYVRRIAELQARYRLVPFTGPIFYACDGNPANEVVATYFKTDPPTLIAERGDSTSLMFVQPSGSGARYQGRNELLWEHQGEATITWGYGATPMRCTIKR